MDRVILGMLDQHGLIPEREQNGPASHLRTGMIGFKGHHFKQDFILTHGREYPAQ